MAKRLVTYQKPGYGPRPSRQRTESIAFRWDDQHAVAKGEVLPVFLAGVVLAYFATLVCYRKGYTLLYGDAVAHLAIARRIVDARWPGLSQLGGVWLPLPHLLMTPFVLKMKWWQSGLGGAPMCLLSYAFSVAGVWKLARRMMTPRWATVATCFYALNANLLFLASTAMTEVLFLALLVWTVIAAVEAAIAMRNADTSRCARWLIGAGFLITGQIFTRYDGWVVGAAVWCVLAWQMWRAEAHVRRALVIPFAVFTVLCIAGPLLWFAYNAKYEGDWLDFLRGPYSAKAIERKTAPPGQHYRGWHNMGWALLFYARTAQVDASAWETGWAVMLAALAGLWLSVRRRFVDRVSGSVAWLLWLPLPFYTYSVAYGSVPIFIPQLWPHSFYNARYGVEMLPALAIYSAAALDHAHRRLRSRTDASARIAARLAGPVAMLLCVANSIAMMYFVPLVLKEGIVNASTRVPFEHALAGELEQMPYDQPVMMYTSAHVGAIQVAGRKLRTMVSEMDDQTWQKALRDPASVAPYVIAMDGDPVDAAVKQHPQGLEELSVVCTTGQPCARVFRSTVWKKGTVSEEINGSH